MYSLNSCETGESRPFQSYDDAVQYLDDTVIGIWRAELDKEMNNVWWINVNGNITFMLTSLEKVGQVEVG